MLEIERILVRIKMPFLNVMFWKPLCQQVFLESKEVTRIQVPSPTGIWFPYAYISFTYVCIQDGILLFNFL